jgi:hypothetical protein
VRLRANDQGDARPQGQPGGEALPGHAGERRHTIRRVAHDVPPKWGRGGPQRRLGVSVMGLPTASVPFGFFFSVWWPVSVCPSNFVL